MAIAEVSPAETYLKALISTSTKAAPACYGLQAYCLKRFIRRETPATPGESREQN